MSFLDRIQENLDRFGDQAVLTEIRDGAFVPVSGAQLSAWVASVRRFLSAAGVKAGDRVALFAPNSAQWVAADLAILQSGVISVPLYSRQKPAEVAVMLADCEPALVLAGDPTLAAAIREAWPEHSPVILLGEALAEADGHPPTTTIAADSPVTIVYTSGTSGMPKGAMITCGNLDYMVEITARTTEKIAGRPSGSDHVFHFLPFCFMGSRVMLLTQLYRGNPLLLSTNLEKLQDELKLADPQFYLNVPAILERVRAAVNQKIAERGGLARLLYQKGRAAWFRKLVTDPGLAGRIWIAAAQSLVFPKIRAQIGARLEFLICGSAPLAVETQQWFAMLGIPIFQVYGLTETTAIITIDRLRQVEPGYVGFAIEGCDVQISEEGELVCSGPNVFPGYWNKPDETAEILRGGWLHTGDKAERTPAGNFRIIGRLKNVLVLESGHNLPPEPLEEQLVSGCPGVKQAVVIGHGRPFPVALLLGNADRQAIGPALDKLNGDLPHYRKIRKFHLSEELLSIENGLLTANGKMRRDRIEQRFREAIEEMYR